MSRENCISAAEISRQKTVAGVLTHDGISAYRTTGANVRWRTDPRITEVSKLGNVQIGDRACCE
jgi:hypothetical protein